MPQVCFVRDGDEQSMSVLSMIRRYQDDGYQLKEMVILYRAHFHSIEMQMALGRNGIPYSITSGISVFEQAHIKDVLSLLQLIVNKSDFIAFSRLICLLNGVGAKTAERLWKNLGGCFEPGDAAQRALLQKNLRPAALKQWEKIDDFLELTYQQNVSEVGSAVIKGFCDAFYTEYLNLTYENGDKRGEDIEELALQIMKKAKLEDFLQEVALLTNIDHQFDKDARDNQDKIHLSTVHQAKGLEWPVVFIIWAAEGMFPSARAIGDNEDDREERRLFYVAVTRAQNELALMVPRMRKMYDGGVMPCDASRFIKEIPAELVRTRHGFRY
jgi:DNA helicase-2/ATP-dependent DNA helicase PcrA